MSEGAQAAVQLTAEFSGGKRSTVQAGLVEAVDSARGKSRHRISQEQPYTLPEPGQESGNNGGEGLPPMEDIANPAAEEGQEDTAAGDQLQQHTSLESEGRAPGLEGNEAAGSQWREGHDAASGSYYYYNFDTQQTQWERPAEGYTDIYGTFRKPLSAQPVPADRPAGWCYVDSHGFQQGPFSGEHLRTWASTAQLSLETRCWFQAAGSQEHGHAPVVVELRALVAGSQQPVGHQPARPAVAQSGEVDCGGSSRSYSEYASAVLAGLPEDDEAVKIAHLAAQSNQPLEKVIQFSHEASSSSSRRGANGAPIATAVHNPRTGRIERLPEEGASGIYSGMESWIDPNTLEGSLQAMQDRKGKKLPPEVWKKLKAKRQAMKEKLRKKESAWLYQ